MRRAPILAATGLAICMLLVACGGGGSTELSKAEFVKQADAICVDAQKQLSKSSESSSSDLFADTAEALQTEADEIDALGAPSADAAQIEKIVKSTRAVGSTLEADKKNIAKARDQMVEAEKLADAYGLESCLLT